MASILRQSPKSKNRRLADRYALKVRLQYRSAGRKFDTAWKRGRTLDMSATGFLIDLPEAFPTGATLELALEWPGIYHDKPATNLLAFAEVVRRDSRGTAVRILRHEFRDVAVFQRPQTALAVA